MTWLAAAWAALRKAPAWLYAILAAVGAFAWAYLSGQSAGGRKQIEKERRTNEEARERMDKVPRPSSGDTVDRLRDGTF